MYGFAYGLLHTIQPCEDKTIFGFHAFGISKNYKEAFKIVGVYALGLMVINNAIGLIISVIGNIFGILSDFLEYIMTYISPLILIFLGAFMFYRLVKFGKRDNHQADPISFKVKKNIFGIFLLGILTGLPPCPFELAVYIQALQYGTGLFTYGFFYVFWFSIGTVLGLFILAVFTKSIGKIQALNEKRDVVEKAVSILLLCFGIVSFILAILNINLFPEWPPTPAEIEEI